MEIKRPENGIVPDKGEALPDELAAQMTDPKNLTDDHINELRKANQLAKQGFNLNIDGVLKLIKEHPDKLGAVWKKPIRRSKTTSLGHPSGLPAAANDRQPQPGISPV